MIVEPRTAAEAAATLAELSGAGRPVRFRGGGTKARREARPGPQTTIVESAGLAGLRAHEVGDFTAVLGAGTRLAEAQVQFAAAGQRLALDPPLGDEEAATVGGVLAAADCGPLRHRYGGGRDLVLGVTLALADGSLARAGGRVIKNVAGYDLAKLFCGSRGALGMLVEVVVRLHPLARRTATVTLRGEDPTALAAAAARLAGAPLEAQSLDLAWAGGEGEVRLRLDGATAPERAAAIASRLAGERAGAVEVSEEDEPIWAASRTAQRAPNGVVVKHSGRPSALPRVLAAARESDAGLVARAALGLAWIRLDGTNLERRTLSLLAALPGHCTLAEAPPQLRQRLEVAAGDTGSAGLAARLKRRFDPAGVLELTEQRVLV